jgi:hypothetical protein
MSTTKASRAVITLGDIQLDVFQLPDESYRWSAKNITEAINIRHSRVAQICSSKQAQSLIGSKFEVADLSPIQLSSDVGNISGYSTEVAFFIWQYESMNGNKIAQSIVFASGVEALERRADAAFGIQRTEEARNLRIKSKLTRRTLTDAIKDYTIRHKSPKKYTDLIYAKCTNYLNMMVLGTTAKEAKEKLALPKHSLLRNHIPVSALTELEFAEKMAARLIDEEDIEPLEAVKLACARCFTKKIGLE